MPRIEAKCYRGVAGLASFWSRCGPGLLDVHLSPGPEISSRISGATAWSSRLTPSALPSPVSSEPTTVPAGDRLRFHDDEDTLPVSPDSTQQHPKHAIDIREPQLFHRTAEDGELLPKSDILKS